MGYFRDLPEIQLGHHGDEQPEDVVLDIAQNWASPGINDAGLLEEKIDALIIVGDDLKMIKNNNYPIQLEKYLRCMNKFPKYYKGFNDEFGSSKRVLEMPVAYLHDFTLHLLIGHRTKNTMLPFKEYANSVYSSMKRALLSLPKSSESRTAFEQRPDEYIRIYNQEDWDDLGHRWILELRRFSRSQPDLLPADPTFVFTMTKVGQNLKFDPDDLPALHWINPEYAKRIIVHCAFDRTMKSKTLWFKANDLASNLGLRRANIYRAGLWPGLGNVENALDHERVKYANCYTRTFHQLHRDKFKFFNHFGIANKLGEVLNYQLTGKVPKTDTMKGKAIMNNGPAKLLRDVANNLIGDIPARVELVVLSRRFQEHHHETMKEIVINAFTTAKDFAQRHDILSTTLIHDMPTKLFRDRMQRFLPLLANTFESITDRVKIISKEGVSHVPAPVIISKADFEGLLNSESVGQLTFTGASRASDEKRRLIGCQKEALRSLPPNWDPASWPFGKLKKFQDFRGNTVLCIDVPFHLRDGRLPSILQFRICESIKTIQEVKSTMAQLTRNDRNEITKGRYLVTTKIVYLMVGYARYLCGPKERQKPKASPTRSMEFLYRTDKLKSYKKRVISIDQLKYMLMNPNEDQKRCWGFFLNIYTSVLETSFLGVCHDMLGRVLGDIIVQTQAPLVLPMPRNTCFVVIPSFSRDTPWDSTRMLWESVMKLLAPNVGTARAEKRERALEASRQALMAINNGTAAHVNMQKLFKCILELTLGNSVHSVLKDSTLPEIVKRNILSTFSGCPLNVDQVEGGLMDLDLQFRNPTRQITDSGFSPSHSPPFGSPAESPASIRTPPKRHSVRDEQGKFASKIPRLDESSAKRPSPRQGPRDKGGRPRKDTTVPATKQPSHAMNLRNKK